MENRLLPPPPHFLMTEEKYLLLKNKTSHSPYDRLRSTECTIKQKVFKFFRKIFREVQKNISGSKMPDSIPFGEEVQPRPSSKKRDRPDELEFRNRPGVNTQYMEMSSVQYKAERYSSCDLKEAHEYYRDKNGDFYKELNTGIFREIERKDQETLCPGTSICALRVHQASFTSSEQFKMPEAMKNHSQLMPEPMNNNHSQLMADRCNVILLQEKRLMKRMVVALMQIRLLLFMLLVKALDVAYPVVAVMIGILWMFRK